MDPDTSSNPPTPRRSLRLIRVLWDLFGPWEAPAEPPGAGVVVTASEGRRLHICTACGADVVNPAHAEPLDEHRWTMLLRCGACGATVDRIASNEAARCYDRVLDLGYDRIARALDRIDREDMAEWADSFVAALDRDLIGAEDFAHPGR
jgi:hypothetical protein